MRAGISRDRGASLDLRTRCCFACPLGFGNEASEYSESDAKAAQALPPRPGGWCQTHAPPAIAGTTVVSLQKAFLYGVTESLTCQETDPSIYPGPLPELRGEVPRSQIESDTFGMKRS